MRKLIPLLLAFSLAGCVTWQNPFKSNDLAAVEAAYGAALAVAVQYRSACNAHKISATCRPIVQRIQAADKVAYGEIIVARSFVKNNPNVDASAVLATAKAAVDAFVSATNGAQ